MNENTLSNIRTMELLGTDDWSRPVYKCIKTGILYKDMNLGESDNPNLYSCGNQFDGDPCSPIKSELEIHFKDTVKPISREAKFNYMLLDRLRMDCEYYLGNGGRHTKHLWAGNEQDQINKMKKIYNSFIENEKPEWLTFDQILQYENLMVNN